MLARLIRRTDTGVSPGDRSRQAAKGCWARRRVRYEKEQLPARRLEVNSPMEAQTRLDIGAPHPRPGPSCVGLDNGELFAGLSDGHVTIRFVRLLPQPLGYG
jgi:hypothetical protein